MKKSLVSYFFAAAGLLLLPACAGPITAGPQGSRLEIAQETQRQKDLAYQQMIRDQDRVYNTAFPILAANTPFCSRTAPAFGLTTWNVHAITPEFRSSAANIYNLHDRLAAQFVADNSPAARAGIRSGDFIVAINGREIPASPQARKLAYQYLEEAGGRKTRFLIERNGKRISVSVQPEKICAYPVILNYASTDLNAHADGARIVLDKGMLRFTQNDSELALVIAHELGHNAMRHIDKKQGNVLLGGLGGLAVDALLASAGVNTGSEFGKLGQELGGMAYSVAFEQEADYVGMYFMERAGYNSAGVADFWRRMATESPKSITHSVTHPTDPQRFIAIDRTHAEIAKKKAASAPLVPNIRQE